MAQVVVTEEYLSDIAQALRVKLGTNETFKPSQMGNGVRRLPTAPRLITKNITANGTYNASGDNADGYSSVIANVPNTYAASDEGKVVDNGALVAQTSKNINANGTHDTTKNNSVVVSVPNSYSSGDEGKVVNNGALVAQTSQNITQNGTYDTTLKNEIVVNVSGGGGGNIPIIDEAVWNAMTTAQKQAQGLVIIQTALTGFERGKYVNGADYVESLLPYSDASHIICEASLDNFDSTQLSWGRGTNPITLSANVDVYAQDSNAVYIPTAADGTLAYVDLGATGKAFTAYIVMKLINPSTYTRVLGAMASRNLAYGMILYGATVNVSSWGSDTSTGVSSSADYFVGCIRFDPTASSKGYGKVNATSGITKVFWSQTNNQTSNGTTPSNKNTWTKYT